MCQLDLDSPRSGLPKFKIEGYNVCEKAVMSCIVCDHDCCSLGRRLPSPNAIDGDSFLVASPDGLPPKAEIQMIAPSCTTVRPGQTIVILAAPQTEGTLRHKRVGHPLPRRLGKMYDDQHICSIDSTGYADKMPFASTSCARSVDLSGVAAIWTLDGLLHEEANLRGCPKW